MLLQKLTSLHEMTEMFMGLDFSTQSAKATIINSKGEIKSEVRVSYDSLGFNTVDGINKCQDEVTTPTLLFAAALDELMRLISLHGDVSDIKVISGCAQQHGSVYWKLDISELNLDPEFKLVDLLKNAFSVSDAPTWMDSSTGVYCAELEKIASTLFTFSDDPAIDDNIIGKTNVGADKLAKMTGSAAFERFTASQIAKISRIFPIAYLDTCRISLISSLIPSFLCGNFVPIDSSDASGMNLMNIHTKTWIPELLDYCGNNLELKLGPIESPTAIVGSLSSYFTKYGFKTTTKILSFTGDNPASLASIPFVEGDLIVSLGSSDTLIYSSTTPHTSSIGHVLCHPNETGQFMKLICFKNGSLTREYVRDAYCDAQWPIFNQMLGESINDKRGFYYKEPEILPKCHGIFFYDGLNQLESFPAFAHPRAIVESKFLSMRMYIETLGYIPKRIIATGGTSANLSILQMLANVFGVSVCSIKSGNSASLGSAYRALYSYTGEEYKSYSDMINSIHGGVQVEANADLKAYESYTNSMPLFIETLEKVCNLGKY